MHAIVLILQLFLQSGEEVRREVVVSSVEECWELAHSAIEIKEFQGKRVAAVAAGCYVPTPDESPT